MKYFSNTSYLLFDKLFKMGIGFFVIIWLTRYLGPERFGLLSYAQSFVSIFMAFASLGISQILVREIVKDKDKRDAVLGTAFYLMLFSSILSIISVFLLNSFIAENDKSKILVNVISFTILFQSFFIIIDSYFQAKVLSKYIVYSSTISFLISSLLKVLLIFYEAPLIYFAYALLVDGIVLTLACIYIYKLQNLSFRNWRFDKKIAIGYLKSAWPLVLVAVSAFIYTRIDQIMIKHMIGDEAVGNYAAAIRISELFYFIPGIIASSLFPKIVEAKQNNEYQYLKLLENLYRIAIWIAMPIAIGIYFFSDIIVSILYGSQYTTASNILSILAWGIIFASISAIFVKMLYAEHFEKKYLYKNLFGVFMNTVLNYFLIKIYGVTGAAMATIITLFSVNYIFDLFDKDLRIFYSLKLLAFVPNQDILNLKDLNK